MKVPPADDGDVYLGGIRVGTRRVFLVQTSESGALGYAVRYRNPDYLVAEVPPERDARARTR